MNKGIFAHVHVSWKKGHRREQGGQTSTRREQGNSCTCSRIAARDPLSENSSNWPLLGQKLALRELKLLHLAVPGIKNLHSEIKDSFLQFAKGFLFWTPPLDTGHRTPDGRAIFSER